MLRVVAICTQTENHSKKRNTYEHRVYGTIVNAVCSGRLVSLLGKMILSVHVLVLAMAPIEHFYGNIVKEIQVTTLCCLLKLARDPLNLKDLSSMDLSVDNPKTIYTQSSELIVTRMNLFSMKCNFN